MTVRELIEALEEMPQDDEVRQGLFGIFPVNDVRHEITYANHYVVIS